MKKSMVFGLAVVVAVMLGLGSLYAQPMGPGMIGQRGGWGPGYGPPQQRGWYCPRGGSWGMGPGYGYGPQYEQPQKPLKKSDAEAMVKNYLSSVGNPNLKLGKIEEKGNAFEANIVTKDNSLVDKIVVDKNTGWMRSAYAK